MSSPQAAAGLRDGFTIHVATVHFRDPAWIEPQLRHIERFAEGPVETWAVPDGVWDHADRFDHAVAPAGTGEHWDNLNAIAEQIVEQGEPGDAIVFLDGDAFPVAPLRPALERLLGGPPLAAVRRDENLGDPMPHPVFCACTVDFWSQLGGDWTPDPEVTNSRGEGLPRDPGGRLLRLLDAAGCGWTPLLRSAGIGAHPLFFGIYGGLIYHHGAGFRRAVSRLDMDQAPPRWSWLGAARALHLARVARRNARLSREVRGRIDADPGLFETVTLQTRTPT